VDLESTCRSCWDLLETESASLVVEETQPIQADENAFTRLLENLVRNAIEHGGEDVTMRIGMLPHGFHIEDNGPGVPEDDREDIFKPGVTTKEDGTGFGMVSIYQITMAHGWELTVTDSREGVARFEFTDVDLV
jgi:signal transduction histidine kinase